MDTALSQSLAEVDKAFSLWYDAVKYKGRFAREDAWNLLDSVMRDYHQGDRRRVKEVHAYVEQKKREVFSS